MRVRVSDPVLVPELLEFLQSSRDVVAHRVSEDEADISLIGSYAVDAMRMELELRIRAWESARSSRGASVELVDESAG
jgi:hypothetical protein